MPSTTPPEHRQNFPTLKRRLRPRMRRVAAVLGYEGRDFAGFQRQPGQRTVEGELIAALQALGLTGGLAFASRTDAGVHAAGQVVAFKVPEETEPGELTSQLSARLPQDIHVVRLAWAPSGFHPRWSATGKEYVYRLDSAAFPLSGELRATLEELQSAPSLSGFTAAGTTKTDAPPLLSLVAESTGSQTILRFRGPAFRRYAIRHMVGAIVAQTRGELPVGSCARIATSPPPYRGPRAPADGLTLVRVDYPPALDPFAGS